MKIRLLSRIKNCKGVSIVKKKLLRKIILIFFLIASLSGALLLAAFLLLPEVACLWTQIRR